MIDACNRGPEPARLPADAARRRVLEQHVGLRQLLAAGLDRVRAALAGQQSDHVPLHILIGVTHQLFVEHLADEEALLIPILEDDLPIGPRHVERLREEHARQRAELRSLCARRDDEDDEGDANDLADSFGRLARTLLADMEHEERELLTPDVLRDDGVVIDQCGG